MHRTFLFGLILAFCICALLACSRPPGQKQAGESKDTYKNLQKEAGKSVEQFENSFITGTGEKKGTTESEESAKNEPEKIAVNEPAEQTETKETPPVEEKEKAVPSGTDPETGLSYDKLVAEIETSKGTFKIKFYHDTAPKHVENFIKLVRKGFFNGLTFHRYVAGFVIQGGDPKGDGSGGPGYTVPAEISTKHLHTKGAVAAARAGDEVNPKRESSGSQFYVCLADQPNLDGKYTVWGDVTTGMDVVMNLRQGDKIVKITIREKQ